MGQEWAEEGGMVAVKGVDLWSAVVGGSEG